MGMNVGKKQLKNRLSYYLRRVADGEAVQVTDRGRVIAEITSKVGAGDDEERHLARLEEEGILTRPKRARRIPDFEPIKLPRGVRASRMVLEDRE